jgi:hypothetical protein
MLPASCRGNGGTGYSRQKQGPLNREAELKVQEENHDSVGKQLSGTSLAYIRLVLIGQSFYFKKKNTECAVLELGYP